MKRPRLGRALAALLVGSFAACGWHAGLIAPPGARTVSIEVAVRAPSVLERGLEPLVSDALSRAVSDLVGLPLANPAEADLVVRGEILEYRRRGGVRSPQNQLRETAVRIDVRATLVDRRTGKVAAEALEGVWAGYVLGDPAEERSARERAVAHLAETLVLELFHPKVQRGENPPPSFE